MTKYYGLPIGILVLILTLQSSSCFQQPSLNWNRFGHVNRAHSQSQNLQRQTSQPFLKASLHEFTSSSAQNEVFILSFDGTVAETAKSRASLAIDAALLTWPHLQSVLQHCGDDSWLINKMAALSHVTQNNMDGFLGCESVLLARLLLEEQQLDEGRSVGRSGKYASRFHPSEDKHVPFSAYRRRRNVGKSRPLTVGEISANWSDGGYLVESLLTRYHIQGQNPLPTIRQTILQLQQTNKYRNSSPPPLHPLIADAISASKASIYITLGHSSHIPTAISALSTLPLTIQDLTNDHNNDQSQPQNDQQPTITIVPPKHENETQADIIQRLLANAKEHSTVFVIHSSLSALHDMKHFLGDDSPSLVNGIGQSAIGKNIQLSLYLPTWAENTHPRQHNNAEMDPWMNLLDEVEFSELLSAAFVSHK